MVLPECWLYGTDPDVLFWGQVPRPNSVLLPREVIKNKKLAAFSKADADHLLSPNDNPSESHHSQLFPYPTYLEYLQSNAVEEFQYTSQCPNKLVLFSTLAVLRINGMCINPPRLQRATWGMVYGSDGFTGWLRATV